MSPTEKSHISSTTIKPPAIKIQRATPEARQENHLDCEEEETELESLTPRRVRSLPVKNSTEKSRTLKAVRKRSTTSAGLSDRKTRQKMVSWKDQSPESETSPDSATSPPRPAKKSKSNPKDVDWADVTDPEERRRIQNRIAQRKFREKARESKERAERQSRNQEHAGNSYRIPSATELSFEEEPSGLPWGSFNLGLVIARGHEMESRRSSGKGTFMGDDGQAINPYGSMLGQTTSLSNSAAEEPVYDGTSLMYGATPCFPSPTIP